MFRVVSGQNYLKYGGNKKALGNRNTVDFQAKNHFSKPKKNGVTEKNGHGRRMRIQLSTLKLNQIGGRTEQTFLRVEQTFLRGEDTFQNDKDTFLGREGAFQRGEGTFLNIARGKY